MKNEFRDVRQAARDFPDTSSEALRMWNEGLQTWDYAMRSEAPPRFRCTLCDKDEMNEAQALRHIKGKRHRERWAMELLAE
jgi:hypothetical protein